MHPDPSLKHQRFHNLPQPIVVMENTWPAGSSTGWHHHPTAQLLYATQGVMVVNTDAGSWVVPPNRALWMQAGLRHCVTMSGNVLMRTAYIDTQQLRQLPTTSGVIHVSPLLRELLVAAVALTPSSHPPRRDALLLNLLVEELRISHTMALHLPMPHSPKLRAICTALMAQPADASTAATLARDAGMGERTLHRLFTLETGMRFAQWREQSRLLHALQRIAEGRKIIDVAMDCGYNSPSAFAAMFKRHFGQSPSSFYQ